MKFKVLKEAALKALMEDDDYYDLDYENAINFPSRLSREVYPPTKIVYGGQEMTSDEARKEVSDEFRRMDENGCFDGVSGLYYHAKDLYDDFMVRLHKSNSGDEFPAFKEYIEGKIQRYREWLEKVHNPGSEEKDGVITPPQEPAL